jgi:hypothetical protein
MTMREEAAERWERKTLIGVAKYKAKLAEMHENYATGIERFWGVRPHPWVVEAYRSSVTEEAADRLAANVRGKAPVWLAQTRAGMGTPQDGGSAGQGVTLSSDGNRRGGGLEPAMAMQGRE